MRLKTDNLQWIYDYLIQSTGRSAHWANYQPSPIALVPEGARSWRMISKKMGLIAKKQESLAQKAEEDGHFETAQEAYLKAMESYHLAQHSILEDDNTDKIQLHGKLLSCYEKVIKYSPYSIEKVEIPWEGKSIAALLHLPLNVERPPCVIFVPGMDMVKELFPNPNNNPFLKRGMAVLSIDGPGQGESNLRKIRVTDDNYERAGNAAIDWLLQSPRIDGNRIGVYGISMGSFWAGRLASFDNRVKACAAVVGCYTPNNTIFYADG